MRDIAHPKPPMIIGLFAQLIAGKGFGDSPFWHQNRASRGHSASKVAVFRLFFQTIFMPPCLTLQNHYIIRFLIGWKSGAYKRLSG
jgi:hypothetical protein